MNSGVIVTRKPPRRPSTLKKKAKKKRESGNLAWTKTRAEDDGQREKLGRGRTKPLPPFRGGKSFPGSASERHRRRLPTDRSRCRESGRDAAPEGSPSHCPRLIRRTLSSKTRGRVRKIKPKEQPRSVTCLFDLHTLPGRSSCPR